MSAPHLDISSELLERLLIEMAEFGGDEGTGVSRLVYSPEWVGATEKFAEWAQAAGFDTSRDAVGNVWATLTGTVDSASAVVTGSHVDTQDPGGRYDGTLGWLSAYVAALTLFQRFGHPKRTLQVVGLCEEESSRFAANFWGSRAISGAISGDEPYQLEDSSGITIGQTMCKVGLDSRAISQAHRTDISAFIELHIEQGPVLEQEDLAVGIVSSITAMRHYAVRLQGVANHAGAFPMDLRVDPVVGMAEIVQGLTRSALSMGRPAVTTIGKVEVAPGGASIIADHVDFVVDVRHPSTVQFELLCAQHEALMREIAAQHRLEIRWEVITDHPAAPCDLALVSLLEETAAELQMPYRVMHSGAGHDSQQMAEIAPVAMIFVRSKDGRSHTPHEFSSLDDITEGTRLLAQSLYKLCYE